MHEPSVGTLHATLSIDVAFIPSESNPLDRLSVSTRASLTRILLELVSPFQNELQSALGAKYDVKSCTRLNIPGLGLVVRGDKETIGVT